jgi:hypothetical protein
MGEIALVVIGILIALQVNNWNESYKRLSKEKVILSDLEQNIVTNITILQESIENLKDQNKSSEIIFSVLGDKLPYIDTLDIHFFEGMLIGALQGRTTNDGYESFKNSGFDLIRSDSIKKQVIHLFEVTYRELAEWRQNLLLNGPVFTEFRHNHFIQYQGGLKPRNPIASVDNEILLSYFNNIYTLRNILLNNLTQSLTASERVLQQIEKELNGNY